MLLFKKWKTFGFPIEGIFQNILCYCLTSCYPRRKCRLYTFQNILCYCLTLLLYCQAFRLYPFQNILCYCLTFADGFRTVDTDISKHPMLLFNTEPYASTKPGISFQNILCYCLTNVFKPFSQLKSLYTPILHYLIQNYQPANHLFKCVFI